MKGTFKFQELDIEYEILSAKIHDPNLDGDEFTTFTVKTAHGQEEFDEYTDGSDVNIKSHQLDKLAILFPELEDKPQPFADIAPIGEIVGAAEKFMEETK